MASTDGERLQIQYLIKSALELKDYLASDDPVTRGYARFEFFAKHSFRSRLLHGIQRGVGYFAGRASLPVRGYTLDGGKTWHPLADLCA